MRQRRHGNFALTADIQRLAARGEDLQMWTRPEQLCDLANGVEHVLDVVEHEERVSRAQEADQQRLGISTAGRRGDVEGGHDGQHHVARVPHSGQGHVECAIAKRGAESHRKMVREARLAGAPGTGERDQAGVRTSQQLGHELHLRVSTDELPPLHRRKAARWRIGH
jgi:hypothetical protein